MTTAFESSAWIDVSQDTGTLILRVCGELDLASRAVVEPAVLAAIPTAYAVVLDLVDLTFCDSSGLALFVAAKQEAEAAGTALTLRNPKPAVARVLELSGLDQALNIIAD
jgi:anti-sigma B factor antagonist